MKGEVPQPGGVEAARADGKARLFAENEKKHVRRKAFYETFFGRETISSPEELPDSLCLPSQALGDIQQAIQQTCEKKREYSQFTCWDPQTGFTPSRLYKGHEHISSWWGNYHHTLHDSVLCSSLVALHYHTHPDSPVHPRVYYPYPLPIPDNYGFFSDSDIARVLYDNTPIELVATHGGIYVVNALRSEQVLPSNMSICPQS